jgi:hypothetical protein
VGAGISEGALWLDSFARVALAAWHALTLRRALLGPVNKADVQDPIASGKMLYAVTTSGQVVVITPPAECFG